MKKSITIWTNYVMYAFLTISLLTLVLYAANQYINTNKAKIILMQNENILLFIDKKIKDLYNCYNCSFKEYIEIPEASMIYISNGWINATVMIDKVYYYNFSSKLINVNVSEKGTIVIYNLSKKTLQFNGDIILSTGKRCLIFKKNTSGIFLQIC